MAKLVSTNWGCHSNVLRATALALVYSAVKYWAPVRARSAHCAKIDVQLNHITRIIAGTVKSTQTIWLPTLSNIALSNLKRLSHTIKILHKLKRQPILPLQIDILKHPPSRLKSKALIWHAEPQSESVEYLWTRRWEQSKTHNRRSIYYNNLKEWKKEIVK